MRERARRARALPAAAPPRTSSTGAPRTAGELEARARRAPSRRQRSDRPAMTSARAGRRGERCPPRPGSTSTGSAVTPSPRWSASDALAQQPARVAAPGARIRPRRRRAAAATRSPAANHAPSSRAAQSWSRPPNGTMTGPSPVPDGAGAGHERDVARGAARTAPRGHPWAGLGQLLIGARPSASAPRPRRAARRSGVGARVGLRREGRDPRPSPRAAPLPPARH